MMRSVARPELNVRVAFTREHSPQIVRARGAGCESVLLSEVGLGAEALILQLGQLLSSMKCILTASILVGSLSLAAQLVLSAECTTAQLQAVKAAQQDPAMLSACVSVIIDPTKPMGLANLDLCKSEQCRTAIQGIVSRLPECEVNGMSISTGTDMMLSACISGSTLFAPAAGSSLSPPPPGANGLPPPPPPGANGLPPPPPGANGLPPPPPGANGLPPPPPGTANGSVQPPPRIDGNTPTATTAATTIPPSENGATMEPRTNSTTPSVTTTNSTAESKTPQKTPGQATVKPEDDGGVDAGDDDKGDVMNTMNGSGSGDLRSGSEDTSINSPAEIDSSQTTKTPSATKPSTTAAAMTLSPAFVVIVTAVASTLI